MPAPGIFPPPVKCELLVDIARRSGGSVEVKSPAAPVEYGLPPHASAEIREFLRPHASIPFAPEYVAWLPGGRVVGPGAVVSPDGKSLARDVSVDFGQPFEKHWL